MGDFTPEIFETLARTATYHRSDYPRGRHNRSTITGKPNAIPDHGNDITDSQDLKNLDDFKNAIFQLLMLRARNEIMRKRGRGRYDKTCNVQLNLTFTPIDIGKDHDGTIEDIEELLAHRQEKEFAENNDDPSPLNKLVGSGVQKKLRYSDLKTLMYWDIIPNQGTVLPSDADHDYALDLADLISSGEFVLACA